VLAVVLDRDIRISHSIQIRTSSSSTRRRPTAAAAAPPSGHQLELLVVVSAAVDLVVQPRVVVVQPVGVAAIGRQGEGRRLAAAEHPAGGSPAGLVVADEERLRRDDGL